MRRLIDRLAQPLFALAVLAAAIAPMIAPRTMAQAKLAAGFPGWPQTFEGRSLTELALTKREIAFAEDFPGRIARFSDGRREIILRWVALATRRLHPASDCFKGLGYSITPSAMQHAASGNPMSCFRLSVVVRCWRSVSRSALPVAAKLGQTFRHGIGRHCLAEALGRGGVWSSRSTLRGLIQSRIAFLETNTGQPFLTDPQNRAS